MSSQLPCCGRCGRRFRPNRFNRHRQKFCVAPECVAARARERKRKSYERRIVRDEAFRLSELARCREGMRRCRAAARARAAPDAALPASVSEALVGLVAHLADSSDPQQVRSLLGSYAERGRRLAVGPGAGGGGSG